MIPRGAGTGMILTPSGQVLTANHVVSGATSITVEVDGRAGRYSARVVGASPPADVALLQLQNVSGLSTVRIGDSGTVREGDEVVAIGNARGRGSQASSGTVTALNRTIAVGGGGGLERLNDLIQVSTLIEEGQSGGPIVNSKAEVVGMIAAARRASVRDEASRTAFAIPSRSSQRIVNEVRAGRASSTIFIGSVGYMGISAEEVGPGIAARFGLNATEGVLVVNAYTGGAAAEAGIPQGSVITAVDGTTIRSVQGLSAAIHVHKPGDTIRVTWVDEEGTHDSNVTLVSGPAV